MLTFFPYLCHSELSLPKPSLEIWNNSPRHCCLRTVWKSFIIQGPSFTSQFVRRPLDLCQDSLRAGYLMWAAIKCITDPGKSRAHSLNWPEWILGVYSHVCIHVCFSTRIIYVHNWIVWTDTWRNILCAYWKTTQTLQAGCSSGSNKGRAVGDLFWIGGHQELNSRNMFRTSRRHLPGRTRSWDEA